MPWDDWQDSADRLDTTMPLGLKGLIALGAYPLILNLLPNAANYAEAVRRISLACRNFS